MGDEFAQSPKQALDCTRVQRISKRKNKKKGDIRRRVSTHLKLSLGDVDLAPVDELDNEFEVAEADVLGHDDGRVLAGVREQQLLKVRAARGQHHLRTNEKFMRLEKRREALLFRHGYMNA